MSDVKLLTSADVLRSLDRQRASVLPPPILEPIVDKKDSWLLLDDYEIKHETFGTIYIPRYFFCDLDSIPRVPFVYAIFKGEARVSALVHDWLYATSEVSQEIADKIFYDLMLIEGVDPWRAKAAYRAVSWFGSRFYGRKRGVMEALMAPEVRNVVYP